MGGKMKHNIIFNSRTDLIDYLWENFPKWDDKPSVINADKALIIVDGVRLEIDGALLTIDLGDAE